MWRRCSALRLREVGRHFCWQPEVICARQILASRKRVKSMSHQAVPACRSHLFVLFSRPPLLVHSVSHTAFFPLKDLSWYFTCAYLPFSHSIFVIFVRLHLLPNDNTSLNAVTHFPRRTHPSRLSTPTDNTSFIPLTICPKLLIAVRCYNDCCCLNSLFFYLLRSRHLGCFIFFISSFLLFHQLTSYSFSSSTSFSSRHSCLCCSLFSINAITTVAIIISSANTIQSPSFFYLVFVRMRARIFPRKVYPWLFVANFMTCPKSRDLYSRCPISLFLLHFLAFFAFFIFFLMKLSFATHTVERILLASFPLYPPHFH